MRTVAELRKHLDPHWQRLRGMVRHFAIGATDRIARWEIVGVTDGGGNEERYLVEVFQGIGYAARPHEDGNPEAIGVAVGAHPNRRVVIGARDEATRRKVLAELDRGESAIFNHAGAKVVLKRNGDIELTPAAGGEIRAGGTDSLVTRAEFNDFITNTYNPHAHPDPASGATGVPTITGTPASGTGTLKGS